MILHCGVIIPRRLLISSRPVTTSALNHLLDTVVVITQVLLETGLPSFNTVVHNSACIFARSWQNCRNDLVE